MFGADLFDSPFAVPDSLFLFVVGVGYFLDERCDFAQFRYATDRRLAAEWAVRAAPVVVTLPFLNSFVERVPIPCMMCQAWDRSEFDALAHQTPLY